MTAPKAVIAPGVSLRPEYDSYSLDKISEFAREAEKRGYSSVWTAESWGLDATGILNHVGARTERIKLGTLILNVFSRTPALLSMASATVNDLNQGRFILGLGTSTKALVEGWHGLTFTKPVTRMRETVEIIRILLSGQEADYQGETVSLKGYRLRFELRNPPPPIFLAALGPEGIKVTANLADGWLPYMMPRRGIADYAATIRKTSVEAGRDAGAVCIAPSIITLVDDDSDAARDAARRHIAFYMGAMGPFYRNSVSRWGFEKEVEAARSAWAAKDKEAAYKAITDEMIGQIAIAGTPAEARAALARFREAGADMPILSFPGTATLRMVETAIDTLATPAGEPVR